MLTYQMSPYGRLYRWLTLALRSKKFNTHPWSEKGKSLIDIMERHKGAVPSNQGSDMVQVAVRGYLVHQDNSVGLAAFLMLINPNAYKPKVGQEFNFWTWPKTEYEMDHGGQFLEIAEDNYVYSGGETKWSYSRTYPTNLSPITTVIPSACEQVEERVRILDGIMNLGYQKGTNFALRIFVPTLGPYVAQRKVMKSIDVMRRKPVQSATGVVQVAAAAATDGGSGAGGDVEDVDSGSGKKVLKQDVGAATGDGKDDVAKDHVSAGEGQDDVGSDPVEVTVLQTKIQYTVKLESWEG